MDPVRSANTKLARANLPKMGGLDEAVADLFELSDAERHIIADFWANQEPDAAGPVAGWTVAEGIEADLDSHMLEGLNEYLRVFVSTWNQRLKGLGEFGWRISRDTEANVIAAIFETRPVVGNGNSGFAEDRVEDWPAVLRRIGIQWNARETQPILRYGMIRAISDTTIVIVKRDERRLWTATAAWQDADATAVQLMAAKR